MCQKTSFTNLGQDAQKSLHHFSISNNLRTFTKGMAVVKLVWITRSKKAGEMASV